MARRKFGDIAGYVVTLGASNVATLAPATAIRFYNEISGGTQYTDLTELDGSTPISGGIVTTDSNGAIPEFLGPDNVTVLYADGNGGSGPRRAMVATDLGPQLIALDNQINQVGGLDDRVEILEASGGGGGGQLERPWEVVVAGTSDADVQAAIAEVLASVSGTVFRKTLIFPPGDYHLTTPLLTSLSTNPTMLLGLSIQGAGKRATRIYWDNAGVAPFMTLYRRLRYFTMSGMTVTSSNANNEFIYSWSDTDFPGNYNQAWRFFDMEFTGSWKRVFGLDGDANANLNSEMKFSSIFTSIDCVFSDGFFVSGVGLQGTFNAQNQFLNYWWSDCTLNIKSGTMFKLNKGGSLTLENSSCSAVDPSNGPVTYFHMPNQGSNNPVVNRLSCRHVYFEPKRSDHKIIDCSWAGGTVSFESCCDEGPLQDDPNQAGYVLHRYVGANIWSFGAVGPSVRYVNHVGAGCIQYEGPTQGRGGIVIEGGNWYRGPTGQPVNATQLQGTDPVLKWLTGAPRYAFRNGYNYTPTATSGW